MFDNILCYLIGSLPISVYFSSFIYKKNISNYGSGNIGFSNSYRVFGVFFGITIGLIDLGRAYFACHYVASNFYMGMFFVCLGQMFSVFLKGQGGKGVACYLGSIFAFNLHLGGVLLFAWQILTIFFKKPFLSSFIVLVSSLYLMPANYLQLFLCCLILFKHTANITMIFRKYE